MSVSRPAAVIVLAAGEGTRMKSDTPKVLHAICGETLLGHVLATARETDPVRLIVVVGHRRREVTEYLAQHAPDVHRFQMVADERLQPLAYADVARHRRIDHWPTLGEAIAHALRVDGTDR